MQDAIRSTQYAIPRGDLQVRNTQYEVRNTPSAPAHDIITLENTHTSGAYPKRPIALVRGQGARVWDADGHEYLD